MVELLEAQWFSSRSEERTKIKYVDVHKRTKFITPKFNPYFFIKREDKDILRKYPKHFLDYYDNSEFVSFNGEPLVKIDCMYPSSVSQFRSILEGDAIRTFESDVPFIRRWMIDEKHRQCDLTDRLYVDIEVDSRHGFPSPKKAKYQVLSIACVDNKGNEQFFCDHDEGQMISDFWWLVKKKYHVMSGWNFEQFDLKYLANRCKVLGMDRVFAPIQYIDGLFCYKKNDQLESKGFSASLDSVSERLLGIGKAGGGRLSGSQMWDSFTNDPDHSALRNYNMGDSMLVKYLDDTYSLLDPFITSVVDYPLMLKDMSKMSLMWEALLLDDCQTKNPRLVMPRRMSGLSKGKLTGGMTLEPTAGVFFAVAVLDFTSLYNSIMQALSISPEFIVPFEKHLVNEGIYDSDEVHHVKMDEDFIRRYTTYVSAQKDLPMFTKLLRRTEKLRNEAKAKRDEAKKLGDKDGEKYWDVKQMFYKTILVSSYGVQGFKSGRFFNPNLVNMITQTGQWLLMETKRFFNSIGWDVLYGDTDSVMIYRMITKEQANDASFDLVMNIYDLADAATEHLRKWIKTTLNAIFPETIELKAEKIYNPVMFSEAKKRYIARMIWKEGVFVDEKVFVGFETKRTDAFDLQKTVQDKISDIIFDYTEDAEPHIDSYMEELRRNLISGELDEQLVIERGMSRDFDEYDNQNIPMLRVARQLIEFGLFKPEDPIRYITVKTKPKRVDVPVIEGFLTPTLTTKLEELTEGWKPDTVRYVRPPIDSSGREHYWKLIDGMVKRMASYLGEPQTSLEQFMREYST